MTGHILPRDPATNHHRVRVGAAGRLAGSAAGTRGGTSLTRVTLHTLGLGDHGSPVVFLHGLFGQGRNWSTIGNALAEEHRVLLVDLPHHGRSPWSDRFDFGEVVGQVAELLSAEDPVTLVGHSLGGKVAMLLALLRPELVSRLCVVDMSPVSYPRSRGFVDYIAAMKALDLAAVHRRQDADALLAADVPDAGVRAFLLQNLRNDDSGWRWQMNLDVLEQDLDTIAEWPEALVEGAEPYPGPVMWLAGGRSDYVRDEYADAMLRWFPRTRRVTVKAAGHWVHAEQPAVVIEALRQFVDQPAEA